MTTATKMTKAQRGDRMVCPLCNGAGSSALEGGGIVFDMECFACRRAGYLPAKAVPRFIAETRARIVELEQKLAEERRFLALARGYLDRRGD